MSISEDFLKRFLELTDRMDCKRYKIPEMIGIGYSTYTRITKQGDIPMIATLIKIADFFNVTIEYLVGRTSDEYFDPAKVCITFHERIEDLRKEEDITTYELAKRLLLAPNFFTEWKRNKYIPNVDNLISIADYFKVSIDYLLGRTDDRII